MKNFYYVYGNMGMTSSGSFSRDKSRWIEFSENDVKSLEGKKPYGATKTGLFIETSKYR
jgi:hypothetical protein